MSDPTQPPRPDYRSMYPPTGAPTPGPQVPAPQQPSPPPSNPAPQQRPVQQGPDPYAPVAQPSSPAPARHVAPTPPPQSTQPGPGPQQQQVPPPAPPMGPSGGYPSTQGDVLSSPWANTGDAAPRFDLRGARKPSAKTGFRGRVNRMLGTKLSPSATELALDEERARIQAAIPTIKYIGIISGKGGVGASTVAQMLGNTLCDIRREPVYAIDGEYGGNLLQRTKDVSGKSASKSTRTILNWNPSSGEHFGSMFRRTEQGLLVVGNPHDTGEAQLTPAEFDRMRDKFPPQVPIRLIDMPTNRDSPLFTKLVDTLSSIVLVTTPEQDAVNRTGELLNTLRGTMGKHSLTAEMVVLINHRSPADSLLDEEKLAANFTQGDDRGAAEGLTRVLFTEYDEHLAEGGPVDYTLVNKDTRERYISVASAVVRRLVV